MKLVWIDRFHLKSRVGNILVHGDCIFNHFFDENLCSIVFLVAVPSQANNALSR